MSIFEKIAFLDSFFKLFKINKKIYFKTEREIDNMISKVNFQIKLHNITKAKGQIDSMPLFYN